MEVLSKDRYLVCVELHNFLAQLGKQFIQKPKTANCFKELFYSECDKAAIIDQQKISCSSACREANTNHSCSTPSLQKGKEV